MKKRSPFRKKVTGLKKKVPLSSGKLTQYINLDNAATTPPLKSVMKAINEFSPWYSSIHRGKGYKSRLSTNLYEQTRKTVTNFVNAGEKNNVIIFTSNTTAAINKLSYRLCQSDKKSIVLTTKMEHHSNDLPWRNNFQLKHINLTPAGRLSIYDLERKLNKYKSRVKLVTVTGASNVTGFINPVYKIARLAHKYKAEILVDGAQSIPHLPFDMKPFNSPEHIDYLVFSAHKMYAPFGTGVLIGPRKTFKKGIPEYSGGGTVKMVTPSQVKWARPPEKEEAGSPNVMGVIALDQALKSLDKMGMKKIKKYEKELTAYTVQKLYEVSNIKIYTPPVLKNQISIIPFNIKGFSHKRTAEILASKKGIAVRNGCFCAQPYIQEIMNISENEIKKRLQKPELSHPGLVRISLGMYNTVSEIDYLIESLKDICKFR